MSEALRIYTLDEAKDSLLRRSPLDEVDNVPESLLERIAAVFGKRLSPQQAVQTILRDARANGDSALRDWTKRLDGAELTSLEVSAEEIAEGAAATPSEVMDALKLAAERIERFYQKQPIPAWADTDEDGTLGQFVLPIERIGIYVPGGTAPLPSTLLMCAIPAKVAGVKEIIVCSPPGPDGSLPAVILAAAQVTGVKRVFKLGGAQAIGGMAFGSSSVPRVDKIVGPGNLFVLLAKREVYGSVGIDGMLGPTETLIIADEQANPELVAADMLAQAEHDILAQAILVTPSRVLAEKVSAYIEEQGKKLSRASIFSQSLCERGGTVIVPDLDTAFEVANCYAPEHLQLSIQEPELWQHKVKHAGAIFLGEHSFEVLGDYMAGPSHSLPTAGSARFASGLNVLDFVKITSVIGLTPAASMRLSGPAETLALAEELTAHAAAARARRKQ